MRRIAPLLCVLLLYPGVSGAGENRESDPGRRRAVRELVGRADSGDAKALYDLAYLHDIGYDSIPVDSVRSTLLYRLSAERGYAPARNFLGFRFYKGEHVTQNVDSAFYWIRLAALDGDVTAAANLGYLLADSPQTDHNEEEALGWLAVAAESGVPEAQVKLVEIAKKSGNAKANALLGDAYSKGRGVPYDHKKSIEYFYLAAKEGDPSAQFILAESLEFFPDILSGLAALSDPEDTSSGYWYEQAEGAGVTTAEEAYNLLYSPPSIIPVR